MDKKTLNKLAYILVLIGGINWGLVGLLKINLVTILFGGLGLEDIVYILVGLSAAYLAFTYKSKK